MFQSAPSIREQTDRFFVRFSSDFCRIRYECHGIYCTVDFRIRYECHGIHLLYGRFSSDFCRIRYDGYGTYCTSYSLIHAVSTIFVVYDAVSCVLILRKIC